ncbi:hypothetical protein AMJ44_12535 [candidate division WOR-1 bacterium DG_54_3]|uniref:Phosphodiester glycosidase domain-containing protein n=1 Tax=candidate division WOR-1 bacterium DG_54_3 TaxID=1703775 RepID=A0A0S7XQH2_UNCSA|nr:MAG: hypothetical protein AMJ44_12535 [candidate division WOR-1 bacterium DG_54_3]
MAGFSLKSAGLNRWSICAEKKSVFPHLDKPRTLEIGSHHKIEKAVVPFGHNPSVGNAGQSEVTALCFDPKYIKIYPMFSEAVEAVKEHWELNPGVCFSLNLNLSQHLENFAQLKPQAQIIAATNGNNLFSHLFDIMIRTEGGRRSLYTSFQNPDGDRSCFVVLPDGKADIQNLLIKNGQLEDTSQSSRIIHGIYGQQIIKESRVRSLLENKFYQSFSGNYSHVFRFPHFISPKAGHSFTVEKVEKCGGFLGLQQFVENPWLAEETLQGGRVTLNIPRFGVMRKFVKPGESSPIVTLSQLSTALAKGTTTLEVFEAIAISEEMVLDALSRSGYNKDDYDLDMTKRNVIIQIRRSRYPHTVLGIASDEAVLVATFGGEHYKAGPTIEEVAETMSEMGAENAILLGNGSESAMYSAASEQMVNKVAMSAGKKAIKVKKENSPSFAFSFTSLIYYME